MNKQYLVKNILWATIIMMFLMIVMLSGCSTVAGVGRDIQDSANWTKEKMGGK
jgi:predicted small secreted protein